MDNLDFINTFRAVLASRTPFTGWCTLKMLAYFSRSALEIGSDAAADDVVVINGVLVFDTIGLGATAPSNWGKGTTN